MPGGPAAALDLADLATIGTVADVAPIVGENRAIARLGLERLRRRAAAGHRRAARAGRASHPAAVDLETVAFAHRAAPQRRRPGGGALEAARLLLAEDRPRPPPTPMPSRRPTATRRDLMAVAVAEAAASLVATRRPGRGAAERRRSSAVRGRSASSGLVAGAPRRGSGPAGRRRR